MAALLIGIFSDLSVAAIEPITTVEAGVSGRPPYMLRSIRVGEYMVTSESLVTGRSTARTVFTTAIDSADNLDLNDIASRHNFSRPAWEITGFGGKPTWEDTNGDNPDFFLFEAGMNDSFLVQAILPGTVLGKAVMVDASVWGNVGLRRMGIYNLHQPIGGIAFAITDLLDVNGNPLTNSTVIQGLRITSGTLDPASLTAVETPEPMTIILLGIGGLLLRRPVRV